MTVERFNPDHVPAVTLENGRVIAPPRKVAARIVRARRTVIDDVIDTLKNHAEIAKRIGKW